MTGSPSKRAPPDGAVPRRRIVFRGNDEHVVAARQLPAQLVRVDLRAGPMPRQKIVDGVQEAEASHGTPPPFDSRTSCSLRLDAVARARRRRRDRARLLAHLQRARVILEPLLVNPRELHPRVDVARIDHDRPLVVVARLLGIALEQRQRSQIRVAAGVAPDRRPTPGGTPPPPRRNARAAPGRCRSSSGAPDAPDVRRAPSGIPRGPPCSRPTHEARQPARSAAPTSPATRQWPRATPRRDRPRRYCGGA